MLSIVPKKNRPSLAGFSVDFLLPYYPVSHLSSRSIQGQCASMGLVFNILFWFVFIHGWCCVWLASKEPVMQPRTVKVRKRKVELHMSLK
jgi:hypothetical protein